MADRPAPEPRPVTGVGADVGLVAAVLEEHDWFTPRGYAWPCCTCGVEFPSNDETEVRAHVATAVLAALRAEPDSAPLVYVDKTTHESCPTRGELLCTIRDPEHRHVAAHMVSAEPDSVDDDTAGLLREWFAQWRDRDDMPPKMADALHVRTALHLAAADPAGDERGEGT